MSIIISNVFSDSNVGGAAITAATIRAAQAAFPGEPIKLVAIGETEHFDTSHPFTLRTFPEVEMTAPLVIPTPVALGGLRAVLRSVQVMRKRPADHPAVRAVGEAHAVISKGGYVYRERPSWRSLMALWMTAFPIALGNAMGKPTAAVCTTIGPFKTRASRQLCKYLLSKASLVVPRDEFSYQAALDLGLDPGRVVYLPDIVFSYERPSVGAAEAAAARAGVQHERFGVLTLSKFGGINDAFLEALRDTVLELLDRGVVDDVLLPVHELQDRSLTVSFVSLVNDPRVRMLAEGFGPDDLMALYRSSRFLIARRMHSAIFALVAGTPTFPFVMEGKKVQGVMGSLGLEDYLLHLPLSDPKQLADRIDAAVSDKSVEERVVRAVAGAREQLQRLPRYLQQYLKGEGQHEAALQQKRN